MEARYSRLQRARLLSLSTSFDTTVLVSGTKADIYTSIKSRRVDRLAEEMRQQGKKVSIHNTPYRLLQEDGWVGEEKSHE